MVNKESNNYKKVLKFLNEKPSYSKNSIDSLIKAVKVNNIELLKAVRSVIRKKYYSEKDYQHKKTERKNLNSLKIKREAIDKSTFKRLYFDCETSPNIGFFWKSGYKLIIPPDNIIEERRIICICYKYEGEDKIYSLVWNNGDDKDLVTKFAKVINNCDEVCGHNSDSFDIRWFRTRALLHGVDVIPNFTSIDTLKLSRKGFLFNSNKLDYIAKFLGFEGKKETSFGLWRDIVLYNDKKALATMVDYCKNDIVILEQVFEKLKNYTEHKTHRAKIVGGESYDCPECTSINTFLNMTKVSKMGITRRCMRCKDCGRHFTISNKAYQDSLKLDMRKE
jgi:uncharacterized protein YprB with RNaseH-like and TPR domain